MEGENYSLSDIATATGGGSGFGGNSAWVLIILFALIFGNSGFGFGGGAGASATANDIQRAVDLNSIQEGQAAIAADVQRGIYEINGATKDAAYNNLGEIRDVGSAVALSGSNIINNLTAMQSNLQNCCCELKSTILDSKYSLSQEGMANTQKILDAISANRMADMQNQINALQLQNAVAGVVRYPMASTYSSGANPFCTSGCGCGV